MSKSMIPLHLVAASTVRHGSEPFLPTFYNLTSVPVSKIYVKHAPSLTDPVNYQPHSPLPVEHLRLALFALKKALQSKQILPVHEQKIKINQPLFPTIRSETVKTIAQPIALARRNSLPSKSTVRPHTPLTAVVSNNYQNLCRSLDELHGAHNKKSDNDPQIFERNQSLHSLHQDADSSGDSEQQEETASNFSRHSPSPILGPRRKNLHSSLNDIHQRFSAAPIPITAPSQPCSRSRPNPPTSFKSPLTPGKPSGSSGSNTKHGTIHGTVAKSPHQTRRPAHFNANVIIRQHSTSQSSCESLSPILTAQQAYTQPPSDGEKSKQTTDKQDSQQILHNATYTTTRRLNATSIKTKQPAPPVAPSTPTENNKQFHRKQTIKMDHFSIHW
ncbi:hypothetical protein OUZ56_016707 [Daphnia magna]|uniref:Uncharacterized protein n=1 Tax=Daphnia magna TaxID=35525 RepID=A0ABR0ARB2_9CRUS|nr:hypothetical protein OUZ56_016707 [Daphnia magna]